MAEEVNLEESPELRFVTPKPEEPMAEDVAEEPSERTLGAGIYKEPETPQEYRLSNWYKEYLVSEQRQRNLSFNRTTLMGEPPRTQAELYQRMEGYDKLTSFEKWMSESLPAGIQKAKDAMAFLPDPIENTIYKVGGGALRVFGTVLDYLGEFTERGSGLVRQWMYAVEDGTEEEFYNNLGNAWRAGSFLYDVSTNTPIFRKDDWGVPMLSIDTSLPGGRKMVELRDQIAELVNQGVSGRDALNQVKDEYYNSLGAMAIRAAKQDMIGHMLFDPLIVAGVIGYRPVDIVRNIADTARVSKYSVGYLDDMKSAMKAAQVADEVDEAARIAKEIAIIEKTMRPINVEDKIAMFLTGQFPEPLETAGKVEKFLYGIGNAVSTSDHPVLRLWQRVNPFSLTPEARVHEWANRIDNWIGTHILAMADPERIVDEFVELASQATSGKLSAMAATPDGRFVQSYLRAAEVNATQLLGDFQRLSDDGRLVMEIARRLGEKTPDVIDNILAGKGANIVRQLAENGYDDLARLATERMDILGKLKGLPYTEDLFRLQLHSNILDDLAKIGIVKYGLKSRGLLQKWTNFMKAGETMAFLRMNPTFAARNWINNETTMIARGIGGGFFKDWTDELLNLTDQLNFEPLRASQAFTMAGIEGGELGIIGEKASQRIAKALQGDATILDRWARKINEAKLPLDFGAISRRMEVAASRKAMVKGYTRAWRQYWKPGGFTSASSFLPQNVLAELGEDAVRNLDNMLQDASSLADIEKILVNFDKVDVAKSASGVLNRVEERIGVSLFDQFEEADIEMLRDATTRALQAETAGQARKIYDQVFKDVIKKIDDQSARILETKVEAFRNAVYSERGMALLDVTEEITNQLDIFEYLYSSGMARFRPMDVSKEVRDVYWPIWLDQQTQFWKIKNGRVDGVIDGLLKGADDLDLNLSGALTKIKNKRKVWDDFFEWRNTEYDLFFKGESKLAWDELIEEIDTRYISAAETDLAILKDVDDVMANAVRIANPDLADGFVGWRQAIRDWKVDDRRLTRTYAYMQKTGELPTDTRSWMQFWQERGRLQEELGQIKSYGYAMMEGDEQALRYFSGLADEITGEPTNLAKRIANDLDGEITTFRARQMMDSEMGPMFPGEIAEEQWFSRNFWTVRELEEEAIAALKAPEQFLDMSDLSRAEITKWLTNARREMSDTQYASVRFAEYARDSALLNYNRKMNYDTWLGTFMPYEFWMTHTIGQWALHSFNNPAVASFFYRTKQMQDRLALEDATFPSRLRGKMKIKVPPFLGMQDWMGDSIYVDPFQALFPFHQMGMPFTMAQQRAATREGRVERELERMVKDGEITQEQASEARLTRTGSIFNEALSRTMATEGEETDGYQLLSALSSVHAPYDIAYKLLKGQPESIGPFLPATYTINRLLGMFGVDFPHENMNAPARIRRWMGLPGFDQWEDYRPERMLSNMSATGEITPEAATRAMIEHEGEAWELARERAAKEFAGGPWWATLLKIAGAPIYIYPEGEQKQRDIGPLFGKAVEAYEKGDYNAYNKFFDTYPEFATRLALFEEPEERLRSFMVDDVWNMYNEMPSVNKKIVREVLGDDFIMRFLDADTSNYDAIPIEQLQMWAKMMGGDPPGTLTEAFPLPFAPPEIANRAEIFYATRNEIFPDFYDLQNKYYMLDEGARKQFLVENPQLKQYWDWRRAFLKQNPTIAPYIDDNFEPNYGTVEEMEQAFQQEPQFSQAEWYSYLGGETFRLIVGAYNGEEIPIDVMEYIEERAIELGLTYEELLRKVGTAP